MLPRRQVYLTARADRAELVRDARGGRDRHPASLPTRAPARRFAIDRARGLPSHVDESGDEGRRPPRPRLRRSTSACRCALRPSPPRTRAVEVIDVARPSPRPPPPRPGGAAPGAAPRRAAHRAPRRLDRPRRPADAPPDAPSAPVRVGSRCPHDRGRASAPSGNTLQGEMPPPRRPAGRSLRSSDTAAAQVTVLPRSRARSRRPSTRGGARAGVEGPRVTLAVDEAGVADAKVVEEPATASGAPRRREAPLPLRPRARARRATRSATRSAELRGNGLTRAQGRPDGCARDSMEGLGPRPPSREDGGADHARVVAEPRVLDREPSSRGLGPPRRRRGADTPHLPSAGQPAPRRRG